jgi:hypothetical protein
MPLRDVPETTGSAALATPVSELLVWQDEQDERGSYRLVGLQCVCKGVGVRSRNPILSLALLGRGSAQRFESITYLRGHDEILLLLVS